MKRSRCWLLGINLASLWGATLCAQPGISFTSVPPVGSTADLAGQVTGVTPSIHRVAVYIFVEGWWNKPSFAAPLTTIQPDGSWTCDITGAGSDLLASKVAAHLVPQAYTPPELHGTLTLPAALETNSLASVIVDRHAPSAFRWCGYDWDVKNSGANTYGPGPNYFSDSNQNVWVDGSGKLHLRITHRSGQWQCAEVISYRSFGYGTYRFFLDSPVDALDPNVVLGLFTYDHDPTATGGHREIDVEMARWGNASDPTTSQYVVQPWDASVNNLQRWTLPAGATPTTHSFSWSAGRVDFVSHHGEFAPHTASIPPITTWSRTGAYVPVPGDERVRMNLWLMLGTPPTDGQEVEVVISRFAFIPAQLEAPKIESFGRDTGGIFHLDLRGEPQLWYQAESSTDLGNWTIHPPFVAPEADFQTTAPAAGPLGAYRVRVVPGQ